LAKTVGTTLLFILLGGILGGYLGDLIALLIPLGFFHDVFSAGFSIGFNNPLVVDLRVIVLTFGIKYSLNLLGLIGMICGLYFAK
jgi:hypothetical protein